MDLGWTFGEHHAWWAVAEYILLPFCEVAMEPPR